MTARKFFVNAFFILAVPVVLIALWILFAELFPSYYWPSPIKIVEVFPDTWFTGAILHDVAPSLLRLLSGYVVALIVGIALGILVGSFRRLRLAVEPVLDLIRAIPPTVLVPVVMIFLGIGDSQKVVVIALGCVWPVMLNTIAGIRSIDLTQVDTAKSYRINPWRRMFRVTLPSAGPQIFAGARTALSIGLIMMVISEMFAAANGIGFDIIQFQRLFAIPEMWSGIVLLGVIGVLANGLFRLVERFALSWYFGMQRTEG